MLAPEPFFSALVVQGDPAVANRMRRILEALAPGRRVLLAPERAEADSLLATFLFDLVIVDMQLRPLGEGAALIARVRAAQPRAQVVAVSGMDTHALVLSAFAAGATGYLLSEAEDAEIAHALRALQSGGVALHPRVAGRVLGMLAALLQGEGSVALPSLQRQQQPPEHQPRPQASSPASPRVPRSPRSCELRPRELQFLRLLAGGLSNQQIADTLAVSIHTVEFHAKNTYRKLEVSSRTQAILEATRHGLLG